MKKELDEKKAIEEEEMKRLIGERTAVEQRYEETRRRLKECEGFLRERKEF